VTVGSTHATWQVASRPLQPCHGSAHDAAVKSCGGAGIEDFVALEFEGLPPLPMAGADSRATQAAVANLRAVHQAVGNMSAEVVRVVRMPGTVFLPEQLAVAVSLTARYGMTAVDWLWVCRCAAVDRSHGMSSSGMGGR